MRLQDPALPAPRTAAPLPVPHVRHRSSTAAPRWSLLAVTLALFLFGACSNGGGGGGGGNLEQGKDEWDSLVWDQDSWK